MKKARNLLALVPVLVALVPPPAEASTVSECLTAMRTLSQRTEDMLFLGGAQGSKAQSQLVSHLSKAQAQLDRLDPKNALKQMDAYSTDLSRAAASGKIRSDNAAFLQESANAVIVCIATIGR